MSPRFVDFILGELENICVVHTQISEEDCIESVLPQGRFTILTKPSNYLKLYANCYSKFLGRMGIKIFFNMEEPCPIVGYVEDEKAYYFVKNTQ